MSTQEPPGHTFLLRIWIEATPQESGGLMWRGFIVHLPDEERTYVESFLHIAGFIRRALGWSDGVGSPPRASGAGAQDPPEGWDTGCSDGAGHE